MSEESETRWIVVGLGNPGKKYAKTPHNIGFELIDEFARDLKSTAGTSVRLEERDGAERAEAVLGKHRLMLVKPLSFMNLSGVPVAAVVGFYKVAFERVVIVHDDIDLPFGSVRIRVGGSDGGHRGIRSIIEKLGGDGFIRLKLGVGRPQQESDGDVRDWVLRPVDKQGAVTSAELIRTGCEALRAIIESGVKIAQNKFNVRAKEKETE